MVRSALSCAALLVAIVSPSAQAQSILLSTPDATLRVGETRTLVGTLTLGAFGASRVDIFMLADNTGSMGGMIGSVWMGADAILGTLASRYDATFGVGRYLGDRSESPQANPSTDEYGYRTLLSQTTNRVSTKAAIGSWFADGGGDPPEGAFDALGQVARDTPWRSDAQRILVWFGDAPSHTETTTRAAAIEALQAADVRVVAFNNAGPGTGIDGHYGLESAARPGQASEIVASVGGALLHDTSRITGAAFANAVIEQIDGTTSSIDLAFGNNFAGGGITLGLECADARGCDAVGGGDDRDFHLIVTGLAAGHYVFDVFARGLGASASQSITVLPASPTVPVPEPAVWMTLSSGMALLSIAAARRSRRRPG